MRAKSIHGKTTSDIVAATSAAQGDGFKPVLAIVFASTDSDFESLRASFNALNIPIFGCSAMAPFVDGDIETHAIVALLLEMPEGSFQLRLLQSEGPSKSSIAEKIGREGKHHFSNPAFVVLSGGVITDGDEIVNGIQHGAGKTSSIFGGLASDSLKMERTFVFTGQNLSDDGLLALILDGDKIHVTGKAIGGWRPMGNEKTITKSNGNIVYTIDHEPAFDFIARYSGISHEQLEGTSAISLSSNFQLQLQRPDMHPVMRTPMYVNKQDRSIVFAGRLPEGSKVKMCLLPGFEVIETAIKNFSSYKKEEPDADALLMFSCAGRQMSLGLYASEEIESIKNIWSAPMAGFFCFGEIGRVDHDCEFNNMTFSLALLKEK
jgi:hypothetical protein